MFQSVRQNTPIYLFHKTDNPYVEVGYVTNVMTRPKYQNQLGINRAPQEDVVDISVKAGNTTHNFPGLPASLEITSMYFGGENVVISTSRQAMNNEILGTKKASEDIVASVEKHKNLISVYEDIIKQINPEYAKEQEQQDIIAALNKRVDSLTSAVEKLVGTLSPKTENNE